MTRPEVTLPDSMLGLTPGAWRFVRYEGEYSVPVHDVVTDYDDERLPKKVATAYHGNENDLRVMALAKEMSEAILFWFSSPRTGLDAEAADAVLWDVACKLDVIRSRHV